MSPIRLIAAPVLEKPPTITHLSCSDLCQDSHRNDLVQLVAMNSVTLTYFSLGNSHLGDSWSGQLLAALAKTETLHVLCLTSLVAVCSDSVCDVINTMTSLHTLVLDNCILVQELGDAFINAVCSHTNLRVLSLRGITLGRLGAGLLARILMTCNCRVAGLQSKLDSLDLTHCGIPGPDLLAAVSSLSPDIPRCHDMCRHGYIRRLQYVSLLENPILAMEIKKIRVMVNPLVKELEMRPVFIQQEHEAVM